VHILGLTALIVSVLSMAVSFTVSFGDVQTLAAGLALVASAAAAGILLQDPVAAH